MARHYDYLLLGSGFAASVLALVLQNMGRSCLLVDRGRHPRFTIGESSTPIADQILLDLGEDHGLPLLQQLARWKTAREIPSVTVGCKQGFSYFFHSAAAEKPHAQLLVPASPDRDSADSHWLRSSVDACLVAAAQQGGADVRMETTVSRLEATDLDWIALLEGPEGPETITAGFVIDGTGSSQAWEILQPGQRRPRSLETASGCVFTHIRRPIDWGSQWQAWGLDCKRHSFPAQNAALHHVVDDGWMWHLAFDNDVISVGWVLSLNRTTVPPPDDLETWWQNRWERYPSLAALYDGAERLRPLECHSPLQRHVSPASGPGWLALPAAVGFVDPLHSTGIAHSLVAVRDVVRELEAEGQLTETFLKQYRQRRDREFWLLDQMVAMAYDSLTDPEKWEAATMVYFAAAIQFEEARNAIRNSLHADRVADHDFLLAQDPQWMEKVVRARQLLRRPKPPPDGWLRTTAEILKGYNSVGLADPDRQGIYQYTAAQK